MSSSPSPKHPVRSVAFRLGAGALGLLLAACAAPGEEGVDVDVDLDTVDTQCTLSGCDTTSPTLTTTTMTTTSPTLTTTRTTTTTTTTTTTYTAPTVSVCSGVTVAKMYGNNTGDFRNKNARLARINTSTSPWSVSCVLAVDGKHSATTCNFDRSTQSFIVTSTGEYYAKAGHSIDPQKGAAGGDYAIGTPAKIVDGKYVAPCVGGSGYDSVGTAYGTELAASCMVETLNVETNTSGYKVKNFATLEVWTNSRPHPDGALLVGEGTVSGYPVYAYASTGAGMNDINGTERDKAGVYYPDEQSCHVTISGGVETMAAKRPATKTWPAEVNKNSPIRWRPVDSRSSIKIAN
jgi:hypothetical protein